MKGLDLDVLPQGSLYFVTDQIVGRLQRSRYPSKHRGSTFLDGYLKCEAGLSACVLLGGVDNPRHLHADIEAAADEDLIVGNIPVAFENAAALRDAADDQRGLVFVPVSPLVEDVDPVVLPIRSVVRLERLDNVDGALRYALQRGQDFGTPSGNVRANGPRPTPRRLPVAADERPRDVIQDRTQVVDAVRDSQSEVVRDGSLSRDAIQIRDSIRLWLDADVVERRQTQVGDQPIYLLDVIPCPAKATVNGIQWPIHGCIGHA